MPLNHNLLNQSQKISEEALVKLLQEKRDSAFRYLYDNYAPALYGIIRKNIADENQASDLLQEVFVRIFKNFDQYDPVKSRLYTWMANITRNLCIDFFRSRQHQKNLQNQTLENSVNDNSEFTHYKTEPETSGIGLKNIVQQLPEPQYNALNLVYFKGFTQQEAAEELGIPLGTIKTRVKMAINTLRKIYQTENL